ncbi:ArsR/SmtB family transcription factor [Gluconacetobacter takamatsuzukensis]|uniref:ArsR/SmtB family transcription factor n=1 Tax=Gluconacetobacter takamatsuzukensis TaxID=1286190 RepID=UPI001C81EEB8
MTKGGSCSGDLQSVVPVFAALGDPIRLSIVARLSENGPLPTIRLTEGVGAISRQGINGHLRVLEEAGLVESARVGRMRQWQLRTQKIAIIRKHLERISIVWDARIAALRALVEDDAAPLSPPALCRPER